LSLNQAHVVLFSVPGRSQDLLIVNKCPQAVFLAAATPYE
jgi:hypothetical protein